jgi:hypothetical protein
MELHDALVVYMVETTRLKLTGVNGVEKIGALCLLLNVCINQKRVCFRVNVLHHNLEPVKASSFWNLHLSTEALEQVLVHNSIGGCEECKNVGNKVSLIVIESIVPVVKILREINLFRRPERSLGLLVHLPDL